MKKCSKCGKEIKIGTYSLISDMCDDCYEKELYKNVNDYTKEYISIPLAITGRDLILDIMDAEFKLHCFRYLKMSVS